MSLDLDVRGYERVLERNGHDPRAVGTRLLGADPARFLLLARPEDGSDEPPHRTSDAVRAALSDRACASFRKVTGVHLETRWTGPTGESPPLPFPERHRALWALPFVTFEELLAVSAALMARTELVVWDASSPARVVEWFGRSLLPWSYDRLDEGWREPRDSDASPAARVAEYMRAMRSQNVIVHDARDEFRFEPATLNSVTVQGVTEIVDSATRLPVYASEGSELTTTPGPGRALVGFGRHWRTEPPGWDWTQPLRVVADVATQGGLGRSFGAVWDAALAPLTVNRSEIYGYLERGPRCSFCDAAIRADGVSCSCPPCVNCGGPHPVSRCPAPTD